MKFEERLKKLRTEKKIRQDEMANHIGVARTTYASYEQGYREPDQETLTKIADFFHVNVDYLLARTDDPTPRNSDVLPLNDIGIQVIMRAKEEMSPKAYQKFVDITEKMRRMIEEEENDEN